MKTLKQLRAKIAAMPREELELFAANVVISVYCEPSRSGKIRLNQQVEWTQDNIENVSSDIDNAGLNPDKL